MGEVVDLELHRRRRMRGLPRARALVRGHREAHPEQPRRDPDPAAKDAGKPAASEDPERDGGGDSTDRRD